MSNVGRAFAAAASAIENVAARTARGDAPGADSVGSSSVAAQTMNAIAGEVWSNPNLSIERKLQLLAELTLHLVCAAERADAKLKEAQEAAREDGVYPLHLFRFPAKNQESLLAQAA